MTKVEEPATTTPDPDNAWGQSLRDVFREVIDKLPNHATLGELVEAAQSNAHMAPVLELFTVQELIDIAKARPRMGPAPNAPNGPNGPNGKNGRNGHGSGEVSFDADGNPILNLEADQTPAVIRRRADVPDGDVRVLEALSEHGPIRDSELANLASLTSDQIRLILRHLRSKGFIHVEGSGSKRRFRLTRQGNAWLRKQRRSRAH